NGDDIVKNDVKTTLDDIMIIAMYMRGWKNEGEPWPVEIVPPSNSFEASSYAIPYIDKIKDMFKTPGGKYVSQLPLLEFDGLQFHTVTDSEKGITISDRINIVDEGEGTENMKSCIRNSSNFFIHSAHCYLTVIGFRPYFSPGSVRIIG